MLSGLDGRRVVLARSQQKISGSSTISRRLVIWIMWYATAEKREKDYSYRAFGDEIDTILKELDSVRYRAEINTGGYKAGLGVPNPTPDAVIRRYRELGEKITFGADAHKPEHIAFHFADAAAIAQEGFRYYVRFKEKSRNICRSNRKHAGKSRKSPRKAGFRLFQ